MNDLLVPKPYELRFNLRMTFADFKQSLLDPQPPHVSPILLALWHDGKGDFEAAHSIAQVREGTREFDRLHAYLHRKEGDTSNAGYWYRRAGTKIFTGSLEQEWEELVQQAIV